MTLLDKLVEIEGKYGMVGTIVGIIIILACMIVSMIIVRALLQFNFNVIDWVCREFFGFKFF